MIYDIKQGAAPLVPLLAPLIASPSLPRVHRKSSAEHPDKKLADTKHPLGVSNWNPSPSTWKLGSGAVLIANYGLFEVADHIHRIQPSVYYDEDSNAACCVFQGYLSNLDELIERYCSPTGTDVPPAASSPKAVAARDPREAAAQVVYRLYTRGEDPLILLSELQGQYAFSLYDHTKRQVFAARDSSGKEPLYISISSEDGSVSVANSRLSVPAPDGVGLIEWEELPPGHYIAGKGTPKVRQFALTPAQLSAREYYDTLEDELSPTAASTSGGRSRRSLSGEFADFGLVD